MPHQNTVLHGLLRQVRWDCFEALVREHGADDAERGFTARRHLVAMLYAQLSGASALREVEAGLGSHAGLLCHLGAAGPVARSTLAEANRNRPAAFFGALFRALLARLPAARAAPADGRGDLPDRCQRAAAERPGQLLGALLRRGDRRQAAPGL